MYIISYTCTLLYLFILLHEVLSSEDCSEKTRLRRIRTSDGRYYYYDNYDGQYHYGGDIPNEEGIFNDKVSDCSTKYTIITFDGRKYAINDAKPNYLYCGIEFGSIDSDIMFPTPISVPQGMVYVYIRNSYHVVGCIGDTRLYDNVKSLVDLLKEDKSEWEPEVRQFLLEYCRSYDLNQCSVFSLLEKEGWKGVIKYGTTNSLSGLSSAAQWLQSTSSNGFTVDPTTFMKGMIPVKITENMKSLQNTATSYLESNAPGLFASLPEDFLKNFSLLDTNALKEINTVLSKLTDFDYKPPNCRVAAEDENSSDEFILVICQYELSITNIPLMSSCITGKVELKIPHLKFEEVTDLNTNNGNAQSAQIPSVKDVGNPSTTKKEKTIEARLCISTSLLSSDYTCTPYLGISGSSLPQIPIPVFCGYISIKTELGITAQSVKINLIVSFYFWGVPLFYIEYSGAEYIYESKVFKPPNSYEFKKVDYYATFNSYIEYIISWKETLEGKIRLASTVMNVMTKNK